MSQNATQNQMNQFVQTVDKFMANYARLITPDNRAVVYSSGNQQLISDYESAVTKGRALKVTIETTVGAWNAAKRGWSNVTDTTSLYIGDAVDWLKGLFGGGPNTEGLGVMQIPAAIWVSGIVASAYLLNSLMTKIFVSIEATKIQRNNPGLSRSDALLRAKSAVPSLFGSIQTPVIIGAALFAAYFLLSDKNE